MLNQYDPFKNDDRFRGSQFSSNNVTNRSPLAQGRGTAGDQDSSMLAGLWVLFLIGGAIAALRWLAAAL